MKKIPLATVVTPEIIPSVVAPTRPDVVSGLCSDIVLW